MDCLLALWPLLLPVSMVTCKVWSSDLYLKKLPCITLYILTQNSIKNPFSANNLGPRFLSLSLIPWSTETCCITQGILDSFLLSLSYQLQTTRFQSIKEPQHPCTKVCQAPLSKGFSRQEYWSGLTFPSPGDLPNPGIKPRSPTLQAYSLPSEPPDQKHS